MIELNLTNQEQEILINLLETCISDLRGEIIRTENVEYKAQLKIRKNVLLKLLDALKAEPRPIPLAG